MAAQTTTWRTRPTPQVSCPQSLPASTCLFPALNSSNQGISLLWFGRLEALVYEKLMDSRSPGHVREASGVRFTWGGPSHVMLTRHVLLR